MPRPTEAEVRHAIRLLKVHGFIYDEDFPSWVNEKADKITAREREAANIADRAEMDWTEIAALARSL